MKRDEGAPRERGGKAARIAARSERPAQLAEGRGAVFLTSEEARAAVAGHEAITLLVARLDGAVIGTLTLAMFPTPTGLRAWIEDVVVDENARRTGTGRALSEAAVRIAQKAGARTVDLTSRPSRQAAGRL